MITLPCNADATRGATTAQVPWPQPWGAPWRERLWGELHNIWQVDPSTKIKLQATHFSAVTLIPFTTCGTKWISSLSPTSSATFARWRPGAYQTLLWTHPSSQTLIFRDWWLTTVISVMFEFLEYSLEHQLPNFSECWWEENYHSSSCTYFVKCFRPSSRKLFQTIS